MKKRVLLTGILLFLPLYIFWAKERSLPGIDIIPRNYWITDQSIIFETPKEENTNWTDSDQKGESTTPSTADKTTTINSYLRQVFPEQFILDDIIHSVDNQVLKRSRWYQNEKTHIVVHHTVSDLKNIKSPEDALKTINAIFKFHTETRDRWDIGYNFIIDPRGNIYEGRGGWESVMGAHVQYNNAPSLGIALLGNFEINEPTEKQLKALSKLSVALMVKYQINPSNSVYVHHEDDHYPYIKDEVKWVFLWHKDIGKTACPGKNLYKKLGQIKKDIQAELVKTNMLAPVKPLRYVYKHPQALYAKTDNETFSIIYPLNSSILYCKTISQNIKVSQCKGNGETIYFTVKKDAETVWPSTLYLDFTAKNRGLYRIVFDIDRASNQAILFKQRREEYIIKNWMPSVSNLSEKIKDIINKEDIKTLIQQSINVLLYELSTTKSERNIVCPNCTITDDQWNIYLDKVFSIKNNGTSVSYKSRTTTRENINSLVITTNKIDSKVFVSNYERKSYAGIMRNNFYGSLIISKQKLKKIDSDTVSEQYVLVNRVSFDQYMRGIIESNDSEPVEKIRTMAILAKNYITYYLSPLHRHPSIPDGVNYNAIDDARIFQKYVGAGVDETLTKRKPALEMTKNKFVMYNNNLAFLPYFSCSAGFTRSAQEKRWWTDTPYLQSVFDPSFCSNFEGHGVGLAGKWATNLANKGMTYREIINYYYSGTSLETIK